MRNQLSDEELADWDYAKISGLGFIDAMCVPHFDHTGSNGVKRSDDAEKMMQEHPDTTVIGVDNNAAFVVVGNKAHAVSGDGNGTCHRLVLCEISGEVMSEPLPSDASSELTVSISDQFQ